LFSAEAFDAATLTVGIATVAAGTLTLFMCHGECLKIWSNAEWDGKQLQSFQDLARPS
jgi:hypothetical protein